MERPPRVEPETLGHPDFEKRAWPRPFRHSRATVTPKSKFEMTTSGNSGKWTHRTEFSNAIPDLQYPGRHVALLPVV